jgi:hypothetical protein
MTIDVLTINLQIIDGSRVSPGQVLEYMEDVPIVLVQDAVHKVYLHGSDATAALEDPIVMLLSRNAKSSFSAVCVEYCNRQHNGVGVCLRVPAFHVLLFSLPCSVCPASTLLILLGVTPCRSSTQPAL